MLPLEAAGARVAFGDGGPRIDNPLRSADDLKSLRGRAVEPDEPVAGTIRRVRERVGDDVPILGFIGAPWTLAAYWVESAATRNFERLMKMRWDDPALLEAFLDRIADVAAAYLRIQIEAGADAVQIFDSWGATLGQSDYMRFSGRFIRRIIESVADLGAPVIVYLNGVAPYLDSLAMLGADCISIDARIDLATARRALPAGIALQGNLDPTALFARPDAVERAVKDLFARFPPASGHVLNLGHGVLPATPVESVRRFFEAARRYGAHQ
jgi:uroporphyrinogen decarboxylase